MKPIALTLLAGTIGLAISSQHAYGLPSNVGDGCEIHKSVNFVHEHINKKGNELRNPPTVDFASGKYSENNPYSLTVAYQETTIAGCNVRLRDYRGKGEDINGKEIENDTRPIGPTMLINPGQTLALNIDNQLPPLIDSSDDSATSNDKNHHAHYESHGGNSSVFGYIPPSTPPMNHNAINKRNFNITNIHTHGWHVDPTGVSDNIFAEIRPNDPIYKQRVKLPKNHVAGTFWYHAHLHGSTTIQVASGMAGVLLVKDEEKGLDSIPQIKAMKDKQLVFQQLAYDESGTIENYKRLQNTGVKGLPDTGFSELNRPTFINGQAFPTIIMSAEEVQRWRMVHAGTLNNIQPRLIKVHDDLKTAIDNFYAGDYTDSPSITLREIAMDGLPTGQRIPLERALLYPGYRTDVLVQANKPGNYFLIDSAQGLTNNRVTTAPNEPKAANYRALLAYVKVENKEAKVEHRFPKKKRLKTALSDYTYGEYKPREANPYETIGPLNNIEIEELNGKQQTVHFLATKDYACPEIGGSCIPCSLVMPDTPFAQQCQERQQGSKNLAGQLRNQVYMTCDGKDIFGNWNCINFNAEKDFVRTLSLNTASEWSVSGQLQANGSPTGHTFHIHVNPFQVQRKFIYPETFGTELGEQWFWKDTLVATSTGLFKQTKKGIAGIKTKIHNDLPPPLPPRAIIKSRYTEFTGAFVQHCHVLNHEDQGMMQVVEVVPDDREMSKLLPKFQQFMKKEEEKRHRNHK